MKKRYFTRDTNWTEETEPFLNYATVAGVELAIVAICKKVEDETERKLALKQMSSTSDCDVFFYDEEVLVENLKELKS